MWSLAIEEQFYLVWPLIVGWLRLVAALALRRCSAIVVAIARSVRVLMARSSTPVADPSRVLLRHRHAAQSLLIGAALSLRPRHRQLGTSAEQVTPLLPRGGNWVQPLSLLWRGLGHRTTRPWLYRGGLPVSHSLVAVVIASVHRRDGRPARPCPVVAAAALDRRDLVRPLPLALAGLRPAGPGDGLGSTGRHCSPSASRDRRHRDGLVLPRRAAGPGAGALRGWRVRVLTPATRAQWFAAAFVAVTASIPVTGLSPAAANAKAGTAPALRAAGVDAAARGAGRRRGVLIGDSVAFTLGVGFEQVSRRRSRSRTPACSAVE